MSGSARHGCSAVHLQQYSLWFYRQIWAPDFYFTSKNLDSNPSVVDFRDKRYYLVSHSLDSEYAVHEEACLVRLDSGGSASSLAAINTILSTCHMHVEKIYIKLQRSNLRLTFAFSLDVLGSIQ